MGKRVLVIVPNVGLPTMLPGGPKLGWLLPTRRRPAPAAARPFGHSAETPPAGTPRTRLRPQPYHLQRIATCRDYMLRATQPGRPSVPSFVKDPSCPTPGTRSDQFPCTERRPPCRARRVRSEPVPAEGFDSGTGTEAPARGAPVTSGLSPGRWRRAVRLRRSVSRGMAGGFAGRRRGGPGHDAR